MKTRKAVIVLRDKTIEAHSFDDHDWAEFLRLNERWGSGCTGGVDLTWKKDGKDMYKSLLTVSTDGKTLTETGSAAGVDEKFTVVYEKQ